MRCQVENHFFKVGIFPRLCPHQRVQCSVHKSVRYVQTKPAEPRQINLLGCHCQSTLPAIDVEKPAGVSSLGSGVGELVFLSAFDIFISLHRLKEAGHIMHTLDVLAW